MIVLNTKVTTTRGSCAAGLNSMFGRMAKRSQPMWIAVVRHIIMPVLAISLPGEHSRRANGVRENCRGNRGFGCRSANKHEENELDER